MLCRESPPRRKKLSSIPTRSMSKTDPHNSASHVSVWVRGAVYCPRPGSSSLDDHSGGSDDRSTLPLGSRGKVLRILSPDGIMKSGNRFDNQSSKEVPEIALFGVSET